MVLLGGCLFELDVSEVVLLFRSTSTKKDFLGVVWGDFFNCQRDLTLRRSNAGDGRQDGQDGRAIGGDVFRNI